MADALSEIAMVSIAAMGGNEYYFNTITENIDIDQGDKPVEFISTIGGGRLAKFNPQEDTTLTFETYPTLVGPTSTGASASLGVESFFHSTPDVSVDIPQSISATKTRTKYRVTIVFTSDTAISSTSSAIGELSSSFGAVRYSFADCYMISAKPSFTDKILKETVKFICPAFDKNGTSNILVESTNATAAVTALDPYTSSVKFRA